MRWPAARITAPDQRATTRLLVFAAAELVLAMAIPFIMIRGYHTLLSSNTGTFVDSPTVEEPGWSALVSATPLTAVIEVVDGGISGATIIVPSGDAAVHDVGAGDGAAGEGRPTTAPADGRPTAGGGTVVLIPGDLLLPGSEFSEQLTHIAPVDAGDALAELLNIDLVSVQVMDEIGWAHVLSGTAYELDNPDPVPSRAFTGDTAEAAGPTGTEVTDETAGAAGTTGSEETDATTGTGDVDAPGDLAFAVGSVTVGGSEAAVFLGRPVDGGSLSSVMPRRHDFWSAMLDDAPAGEHPVADAIRAVGPGGRVVELPTVDDANGPAIDATAAEGLLRDIVAFPSGNRLEIRLVDRVGGADLGRIAAQLASRGLKVVEIANAVQFDSGSTELIRPTELADGIEQLHELVAVLGVEPIVDPEQEHDTVTLLVGSDFPLTD